MKQAIQLGVIAVLNVGIVFLFQWYILVQLGPGLETDALFAGMIFPQLILAVVSASLTHVLVPLLAGQSDEEIRRDTWGFAILVGGLFAFLAMLLFISAPWWVAVLVPGFSEVGKELTVTLTRVQLIGMVLSAVNGVQWAAYHARKRFVWAEFTPVLANVAGFLLLLWLLPAFGVTAAAWILVLRAVLQTVLLAPAMGRPCLPDLGSPPLRLAWARLKPLLLGATYYKTDPVLDRFLLSSASTGTLSLYHLAQQILSAATHVINRAVSVPLTPLLSSLYKSGERAKFRAAYYQKLFQVSIIAGCGLIGFYLVGEGVLSFLVGRGKVGPDEVILLWWIIVWLSGVFFAGVAGQICATCFYSMGDTLTPTRLSIATYTVSIPLKFAAFYGFGVMGLALVASGHHFTNLFVQLYLLRSRVRES
jgi:putative peptidoglycan lipid II flippase